MSLQHEIIIRYRDEGHVRFELPSGLCESETAARLIAGLRRIEGVYRVDFYARQKKLSVRFLDTVVDFIGLARGLNAIVDGLTTKAPTESSPALRPLKRTQIWREKPKHSRPVGWLKEKYQELKETVTAAGILIKAGARKPGAFLPSTKATMDFLTDILVLYLIKVHWRLILNDWMRRPLQYKSEWVATFYMIFLLMRSRIPRPN